MSSPTISVLLSVYNAEKYVAEAIESILAQTFTDFEFIIIDDGSTDGSAAVIAPIAARDSRIRFISRANKGIVESANEELSLAAGEFLARMDADDIALPTRFEKQIAYMREHADCVCLGSKVTLVDSEGEPLGEMPKQLTHEEIDAAHLTARTQAFYHSSGMYRHGAVRQIGGYREYTNIEDLDLFLRLAEVGKIANLPEPLTKYRQHMQSIGHARMSKQQVAAQAVLDDAHRRRGLPAPAPLPAPKQLSERDQRVKWAWWALRSGHIKTARKHAFRALKMSPFRPDGWKVAICAMRGR